MLSFVPDPQFYPTYKRYPELWTVITSPAVCFSMRGSASIGVPAVSQFHKISKVANFLAFVDAKDPAWSNRLRQLIGHVCRQVMEQLGYELIDEDVELLVDDRMYFQSGAIYRWKESSNEDEPRS